jgi:hypothetical protein
VLVLLIVIVVAGAVPALGQGGKAEASRIEFVPGKSSATLTGRLSNGSEMEYVFAANKGQTVTITNSNKALFDFRVFSGRFDFDTEFDSSKSLTFQIPESGDYMFSVRKRQVKAPRTAHFSLTCTIK